MGLFSAVWARYLFVSGKSPNSGAAGYRQAVCGRYTVPDARGHHLASALMERADKRHTIRDPWIDRIQAARWEPYILDIGGHLGHDLRGTGTDSSAPVAVCHTCCLGLA